MRIFKILTVSTLLSVSVAAAPGVLPDGNEIYLDTFLEITNKKKEAAYYCELVEKTDKGYHYKAYFLSGELKMEGWFSDQKMEIEEGPFVYYYQSGKVESKGKCQEGSKVGIWQRFNEQGIAKPEKVYESLQVMKAIEDAKKLEKMQN